MIKQSRKINWAIVMKIEKPGMSFWIIKKSSIPSIPIIIVIEGLGSKEIENFLSTN